LYYGRSSFADFDERSNDERTMIPTVVLSSRGEQRLRSGHPWIYRSDVGDVHAAAGDRVAVRNARGRTLGYAMYSDRSQIALRMLSYGWRSGSRRRSVSGMRWALTPPRIG
jgi:pseudouridine/archaeosine synthase-like protein